MNGGFRVEPGSAARDAEQRAREAGPAPFRNQVGIRVGGQVGGKFEFEKEHSGPGERLPAAAPVSAPPPQAEVKAAPVAEPPSAVARVWSKFRNLFSSKK